MDTSGRHFTAQPRLEDADVAKLLIENGADVNAVTDEKDTALHFVAIHGHVDVAALLLQNGADVNAVHDEKWWTPLGFAAQKGHVDIAKVLIQNGADLNAIERNKKDGISRRSFQ